LLLQDKNLYGRDGRTICGPQWVPKSTDAVSACRKVRMPLARAEKYMCVIVIR